MIRIRETFLDYFHGEDNKKYSIVINPTIEEIEKIWKEDLDDGQRRSNYYFLRGLIVNESKLYVWFGDAGIHRMMMSLLDLHGKVIPIFLHVSLKDFKITRVNLATSIKDTEYWNQEFSDIGGGEDLNNIDKPVFLTYIKKKFISIAERIIHPIAESGIKYFDEMEF